MDESDAVLVVKALAGERKAFEKLLLRYQKVAYNIAFRMLRNHEEAEDATQEAFIRIYKSLNTFRQESKFSTWLYRIVTNVCLVEIEKAKSKSTIEFIDQELVDDEEDTTLDNQEDVGDLIARKDFNERVIELIEKLPPHYKTVLTLYHIEEFSYEEIEKILNIPMGTVKVHLFRARQILKNAILKEYAEEIKGYAM